MTGADLESVNNMRGKFITLEGSDGAGKTTVLRQVLKIIKPPLGTRLLLTREPGGNPIAEEIRRVILDPRNVAMNARTEALLYAAARSQHVVQTIRPALKQGRIVLCDRYVDSSIAYQGGGRRLGVRSILRLNRYATRDLKPDLTIYFQIPAQVGLDRIKKHRQNDVDRLDRERLTFYERVNETYRRLAMANPRRIQVVDADRPVDQVVKRVVQILKRVIKW